MSNNLELKKALTPLHLWGIGVGIVISGDYFGWNFGLASSGYVGMLIATALIAVMYSTMCLSIAELSTIMPHAGGPYAFARRAMGPLAGYLTGIGVVLEFFVAAAVVASGAGFYVNSLIPEIHPLVASSVLYLFFFAVHILGIKEYATIEMVLVTIAVGMLIVFAIYGTPQIEVSNLFGGGLDQLIPGGISGVWAALPYAMWLYLALEMLPMLSEECRNPKKDMPRGIMNSMITLLILSVFVVTVTVGLGGVQGASTASDPLSYAISAALGNIWLVKGLTIVGLFALISSLAGIILAYSRQVFALSRAGYFPAVLSRLHQKRRTPYMAIVIPGILGFILVILFNPEKLILIATFGALVSYIMMNLSLLILRKKEPNLARPYKTPFYPAAPIISIAIAAIALFSTIFDNLGFFFINLAIFGVAILYYYFWAKKRINADAPEEQFSNQDNKVSASEDHLVLNE